VDTSDDIRFEVPQEDAAQDLCQLLELSQSHVEMTDSAWSVQAAPGVDPIALALLLRRVEAWVAERGLYAIRFHLDGRWYVMESGEATWALQAA
jgi:hypothetical protein